MTHRTPNPPFGTIALHFLVAITALIPTAGRDWLCVHEGEATPTRAAAHRTEVDQTATVLTADDLVDSPPHDSGCPCCQRPTQRMMLGHTPTRGSLQPALTSPIARDAGPLVRQHHARPTSRGPPAR